MKIIYMGTPKESAYILEKIIKSGIEVIAVFTQEDKRFGRKNELTEPEVKKTANKNNIPVYQPKTLKDKNVINQINNAECDFIVVAIYGQIVPKDIIENNKCINIHTSLLPKYRGASPIQQSILNNDDETGVTCILMDNGLDTGDIIKSSILKIQENEMVTSLFDRV